MMILDFLLHCDEGSVIKGGERGRDLVVVVVVVVVGI